MNRALWIKALSDAWRQFVVSALLLTLFSWLFVWLMSRFPVGGFGMILSFLPGFVEELVGVPLNLVATPVGQLSVLYIDLVTLLVCAAWALGRGSDVISGEIARVGSFGHRARSGHRAFRTSTGGDRVFPRDRQSLLHDVLFHGNHDGSLVVGTRPLVNDRPLRRILRFLADREDGRPPMAQGKVALQTELPQLL
jgi:hypothetical protein